jgi:hypothetical protein
MWTCLVAIIDLAIFAFAMQFLLLSYGRIGKPKGPDRRYDAWVKRWSGIYKVLGYGLMIVSVLLGLALLSALLAIRR